MTNPPLHVFIGALSLCGVFVSFFSVCHGADRCLVFFVLFCFFGHFLFSALCFSPRWDFDECSFIQQPYYCFCIESVSLANTTLLSAVSFVFLFRALIFNEH